jgi:hypothetical protein
MEQLERRPGSAPALAGLAITVTLASGCILGSGPGDDGPPERFVMLQFPEEDIGAEEGPEAGASEPEPPRLAPPPLERQPEPVPEDGGDATDDEGPDIEPPPPQPEPDWIETLQREQVVFNAPEAEVGVPTILKVVIDPGKEGQALVESLEEGRGPLPGAYQEAPAPVAARMTANLECVDPSAEITINPIDVLVRNATRERVEWSWQLTALQAGDYPLELELLVLDEGDAARTARSFETTLVVTQEWWQPLLAGVQDWWELAVFLGSMMLGAWRWWVVRRRRPPLPSPEGAPKES